MNLLDFNKKSIKILISFRFRHNTKLKTKKKNSNKNLETKKLDIKRISREKLQKRKIETNSFCLEFYPNGCALIVLKTYSKSTIFI